MINGIIFPFEIVQFSGKNSNVPRNSVIGVFQSQIVRYFRICSDLDGFTERLLNIIKKFVELGFKKKLLKSIFVFISSKHEFRSKFTDLNSIITSLFDQIFLMIIKLIKEQVRLDFHFSVRNLIFVKLTYIVII